MPCSKCSPAQDWALPKIPSATGRHTAETRGTEDHCSQGLGHTRQSCLRNMAKGHPGLRCLPGGSVSSWPAFLCTMAGYVMVSLLLCSFRTTALPVLDKRTAVTEERRNLPGHLLIAVQHWPEASCLRKGTGQRSETHLQWGHRLAVMCDLQKQAISLLLLSQTVFTC